MPTPPYLNLNPRSQPTLHLLVPHQIATREAKPVEPGALITAPTGGPNGQGGHVPVGDRGDGPDTGRIQGMGFGNPQTLT